VIDSMTIGVSRPRMRVPHISPFVGEMWEMKPGAPSFALLAKGGIHESPNQPSPIPPFAKNAKDGAPVLVFPVNESRIRGPR
jgi:hypothetical protein